MRVIIRDGDEITVADTNSIDDPRYIVIGETGGSGKAHTFNVPAVTGSYTYNGAVQTPTLSEYYSDFMTLSGEVSETNAGTYTITVALKDIANCQWSDHSVGNKTLTWSIGKAALPKPTISPASIVLSEISPSATFSVTRAGNGAIVATSSDPESVSVSVSGNTVTVTALDTSEELETTVIVTVGEGSNYLAYTAEDVACAVRIGIPAVDGCVRFHGTNVTFNTSCPFNGTVEFSLDGVTWQTYTRFATVTATGSDIFVRGTNNTHWNTYSSSSYPHINLGGSNITITGKIETLLDYNTVLNNGHPTADDYAFYELFKNNANIVSCADFELPSSSLSQYEFFRCFYGCSSLVNAPALPSTSLKPFCYYGLFFGCTSLVNAPALPATIYYNSAYVEMFAGCTSLINAPQLPIRQTGDTASLNYERMFSGCTSLVNAPALPATLNKVHYGSMFSSCTALLNAPALPALSLRGNAYLAMFAGCTSLVTAPNLPATTLGVNCYERMFQNCTSLINAPTISATTMNSHSCLQMFEGCSSLVTAPALPATTLEINCYQKMFYGCTSLLNAPELSASTVPANAYSSMFRNCTALVNAPTLPALSVGSNSYSYMFAGCTSLVDAPALPATTLGTNCYASMFEGCINLESLAAMPALYYPSASLNSMYKNCTKIKISLTQTDEYTYEFRVPTSGTATADPSTPAYGGYMFEGTGGTYTGSLEVNTTYYTSNAVISS